MSLGFDVEALLARGRSGSALRMGLSRIAESEWLQRPFDHRVRAEAFDRFPDAVQVMPQAEAAGREVASLVGVAGGLEAAARATWEDLCILTRGDGGRYRLTGGAVGFPTDWRLGDKMGLPLTAIHAPIHGYAEELAAGVDHFMETMPPDAIFGRTNSFVVPTGAWRYMPTDDPAQRFAHVTGANAGQTLYIRCERQTLRRLPGTGAVLFTIGIAVARIDALSIGAVRTVAEAQAAQSAGEQGRRAAPYYMAALHSVAAE